jgi:hypothetical protein
MFFLENPASGLPFLKSGFFFKTRFLFALPGPGTT